MLLEIVLLLLVIPYILCVKEIYKTIYPRVIKGFGKYMYFSMVVFSIIVCFLMGSAFKNIFDQLFCYFYIVVFFPLLITSLAYCKE